MNAPTNSLGGTNLSSEGRTTPLATLLTLYVRSSPQDTYCNFYEGFRALLEWLKPIEIPQTPQGFRLSRYLGSWEVYEISRLIGCAPEVVFTFFLEHAMSQQSPQQGMENANTNS